MTTFYKPPAPFSFFVMFQAVHADGTLGDRFLREDTLSPNAETAQRALSDALHTHQTFWNFDTLKLISVDIVGKEV